jgi:hypothetical protein
MRLCLAVVSAALFVVPARAQAPDNIAELSVEPAQLTLAHKDDAHRLVVSARLNDGSVLDLTRTAVYSSTTANVVTIDVGGIVRPAGKGETTIEVRAGGKTAKVAVSVKSTAQVPVSFAHDVMPLFAKAGCNSGACHGSASGKKGFKVSLRGYDPGNDYITLTRGTTGRRLDLLQPERSLLLMKPTGQVIHEGGKRFDHESRYAGLLRRWIAEGAVSDLAMAPKLVGLDVFPSFRTFAKPGLEQQLLARARYSDGGVRDVTADTRFSSSNDGVADPSESGLVRLPIKGEAAVTVRYGSLIAVSNLVVLKHDPAFAWNDPPENNYVDKHVYTKLKAMEILPSELTTDEEFLRRVSYDVIGLPPTPKEVRDFLADTRIDKRARKIDELLVRPEHAEFWALKWGDLFRLRIDTTGDKGTWSMYRWLRDGIAANRPFDKMVRDIVTAEGSTLENPPANFWRVFTNANDASEATVQVFLGIRLMCAKCHDHPFEKWVQKDYFGMSAFFAQVNRKANGRRDDQVIFLTESPVNGKLLDNTEVKVDAESDARERLADWMTRKDNPLLARATVNRLWSQLFGKGIIDPVDDIRSSNPPVNAPLLDALTRDFLNHDYDVRHILRVMLNSRTYQLSARANRFNADDKTNFSHALPRRLTAEQLLDTVSQITGVRENFRSRVPGAQTVALPVGGLRAGQLPDRALTAELLDLFGRPRGESSCSCERSDEASMTQALHMINGKTIAARLANPNGRVAQMLKSTAGVSDEKLIEEMYLMVLCRLPRANEQALMLKHLKDEKDRPAALQDIVWVLLNTKEFLFNH